jgi:hypothetical protein
MPAVMIVTRTQPGDVTPLVPEAQQRPAEAEHQRRAGVHLLWKASTACRT